MEETSAQMQLEAADNSRAGETEINTDIIYQVIKEVERYRE